MSPDATTLDPQVQLNLEDAALFLARITALRDEVRRLQEAEADARQEAVDAVRQRKERQNRLALALEDEPPSPESGDGDPHLALHQWRVRLHTLAIDVRDHREAEQAARGAYANARRRRQESQLKLQGAVEAEVKPLPLFDWARRSAAPTSEVPETPAGESAPEPEETARPHKRRRKEAQGG